MPVHAHDLRIGEGGAHVRLELRGAVVLVRRLPDARAERSAIRRAEMELANHDGRVQALGQTPIPDRLAIDVVTHHIAVLRAGGDGPRAGAAGKTAAEVEEMRIERLDRHARALEVFVRDRARKGGKVFLRAIARQKNRMEQVVPIGIRRLPGGVQLRDVAVLLAEKRHSGNLGGLVGG